MPDETEGEVAAIVARLREEVFHPPAPAGTDPESRMLAARSRAERAWAVTAERPFEQPPNRRGPVQSRLLVPVKRMLRKLMRWYVEPVAAQQRSFNLAVLDLVNELAARYATDVQRLERRLDALEERRRVNRAEQDG
ncbi:MAG TPA: hypothetical protein VFM13_11500 [Gaiellaceae bacterium]|nr:hypothetical protein [Gaiellaceae bacterium]